VDFFILTKLKTIINPSKEVPMAEKKNKDIMQTNFASVNAEAGLKEAFKVIEKNLQGPPHSPGLVVLDQQGKHAGVLTLDDFMKELSRLYRDACDQPGRKDWGDMFFNQCELAGVEKVSGIMSAKGITVGAEEVFDKSCELMLSKNLPLLPVVDPSSKAVGIITRRMVLEELGPKMFK
jgi:predicted transcriptional regulator